MHTGTEALAALTELHPDLMLLDVYLPDMTGIEVLRRARQDFPDVDVIVVTAARELDTVREAMQGGAVSYLVKPFEYQALGERLEHYRRTRSALSTSDVADQKQIDQLFGLPAESGVADQAELPKGLSRETACRRAGHPDQGRGDLGNRMRGTHRAVPGQRASISRASGTNQGRRGEPEVRRRTPRAAVSAALTRRPRGNMVDTVPASPASVMFTTTTSCFDFSMSIAFASVPRQSSPP